LVLIALLSLAFTWAARPAFERRQMRAWIQSRGGAIRSYPERSMRDKLDD